MAWFRSHNKNDNIEMVSSIYFDDEAIRLPFSLNENHRVFLDFQLDGYVSQMQLLGNSAGNTSNFYVGLWNGLGANNFYVRTSDGEHYQVLSDYTARHSIDINKNGKVLVDGTEWLSGKVNTNNSVFYTIGYRNVTRLTGKVFRFFIYDTINDVFICDLRPARVNGGEVFLYDIINKTGYTKAKA